MKRVAPFHYHTGRFVLLRHFFEGSQGKPQPNGGFQHHQADRWQAGFVDHRKVDHWDLMFDTGHVLLTYRLLALPQDSSQCSLTAERLSDHRRHYLDYEGPVSGNRGVVHRWASGHFAVRPASLENVNAPPTGSCETPQSDTAWLHLAADHLQAEMLVPESVVGDALELQVDRWEFFRAFS